MAIQTIQGGFPFPAWPNAVLQAPSLSNNTVGTSQKAAAIYRSLTAKNIRKVRFRTGSTTTGGTLDVRIETVDATTGLPTGTLFGTNTNISFVLGAGDDNVWLVTAALTADADLAVGDLYAIVIVADGTATFQIPSYVDGAARGFPYSLTTVAGTYGTLANNLLIVPEYSDATLEPQLGYYGVGGPINSNTTFNSGATTNRRGNIFQLPFPCQTNGCWAWLDTDGDYSVRLYDSDGTSVLATTGTIDKDIRSVNEGALQFLPFTTTANLLANTNYRIVVVPETVTDLVSYDFDIPVAAMMDMFSGGQACHSSVFTSSAWVETTTRRAYLGIFLNGFDDGAGGGSGGGLRLAGKGGLAVGG